MATDAYLLNWVQQTNQPTLRIYSWDRESVSFGYFQSYVDIAALTPVRPLVRRPTGGGLVSHLQDWTYSVAIPNTQPWYQLKACESYCRIHRWVNDALNNMGISSSLAVNANPTGPGQCFLGAEENDILFKGFKIAGAAQRRTREGLLIQGSVQISGITTKDRLPEWIESIKETGSRKHNTQWNLQTLDKDSIQEIDELVQLRFQTESFLKRR